MTSALVRAPGSRTAPRPGPAAAWLPPLVVAGLLTYLAPRVLTGADTMWMVALGGEVAATRAVPTGVPFAAADTSSWPNVPVLGELTMSAVHALGPVALALALLAAGATMLLLLAQGARRLGAHPGAAAATVCLAAVGMLPVLGVVRGQLLSLVPFALLVVLLRAEERAPSSRIWLVVPLLAVWGNLHGGVLVGVALSGCYLLLSRLRRQPLTAVIVGLAALAAVWLNPALARTGAYYLGVLTNEAAQRGTEMWARPDLGSPFDLLLVLTGLVLGGLALRWARMRLWEVVATFGMAVATATSARHGMWLLMFLIGPAAVGLTRAVRSWRQARTTPSPTGPQPDADPASAVTAQSNSGTRMTRLVVPALTVALIAVATLTVLGRSASLGGPRAAVATIASVADGGVVLAPEPLVEELAAAHVTVWASNPIDAFRPEDQAAYLDVWLGDEGGRRAIAGSDVVVVVPGSPAARLAAGAGCAEAARTAVHLVLRCPR